MNYSHILSIQVWSDKIKLSSNYGNILLRVKELIINEIQTQEVNYNGKKELVSLFWKKVEWTKSNNSLYNSDIVTDAEFIKDEIIYQHTKQMLEEIEEKLCLNKKFDSDYKIIFSIVKPVVQKTRYLDNIALVDL